MSSRSDAWRDEAAKDVLLSLADRGCAVRVAYGRLVITPGSLLTPEDRTRIVAHRDNIVLLALAYGLEVLARVSRLADGQLVVGGYGSRGRCDTCGDALPAPRVAGPCGWCRLALMTWDWGYYLTRPAEPLTRDVLHYFPAAIAGARLPEAA